MPILVPVQTFWAATHVAIGETARLVLTWRSTGAATGDGVPADGVPVLSIHNSGLSRASVMDLTAAPVADADVVLQLVNARRGMISVELDGLSRRMDLGPLPGLDAGQAGPGPVSGMRDSTTLWLDRSGFAGNAVAAHRMGDGGAGDLVFLSARTGSGISVYQTAADNTLTRLSALADTGTLALEGISAMTSLATAGGSYLIAASISRNTLVVLRIGAGGNLSPVAQIGTAEMLPVDLPTQIGAVTLNGQHFVLMGSFGTGSITVLRMAEDGTLAFADQLIDSLLTRFGGLSAMDMITVDGQVLVAAAGGDGGVSLFQLLPSGRLVLRETLTDTTATALQNIQDLRFVMVEGRLELFALASGDHGVTRILVDPARYGGGAAGITSTATAGTDGNDILTAPQGGAWVRGGAGDDILIGGSGRDTLEGGAGADLYMPLPDATERETLLGFDPAVDRIDLSGFPLLRSLAGLTITPTATGALIRIGATEISLVSDRRLTLAEVQGAILFSADRVLVSAPVVPVSSAPGGGADADTFFYAAGARVYDGGSGTDRISYATAPVGVGIDLVVHAQNSGAATGHELRGIEIIEATAFGDRLAGDATGNTFVGGGGNDSLDGRDGNDWITPGAGNDTVEGGPGTDMVSFVDAGAVGGAAAGAGVSVSLITGLAHSGGETDVLRGIENITGSVFGDAITGDAAANLLRGLGDYDWITGGGGGDTIDGGTGRDMVSYVGSATGVTVDLGTGRGTAGMAAGDSYVSIERVTGSVFADIFLGSAGEDDFRGLGGSDWFTGSAGRDRYDGGAGSDTVAYSAATAAVAASLLLGRGTAGQAARDLYTAVENLTGSSFGDSLTGDNDSNTLRGLAGDDLIFGNGGTDVLTGGRGNDTLSGGSGWDRAVFSGARADYVITGTAALASVTGSAATGDGRDTLTGIEVLVFSDGSFLL